VCVVNSVTFTVGEGEADILDPRPPGNACQRRNLHEDVDSGREPVSGNGREWLDIIREIGRKHFALVPGSRCGVQERSARMILRLRTERRTGLVLG
jgi:hypothetical protein